VLGGEGDPMLPIECQADIAAALPQHLAQFERLENCGHAVVFDAPERAMAVTSSSAETKPAPEGAGERLANGRTLTSWRSRP
jgi:pimeloyl-ACP methyl ester carboxylesterase